MQGGVLSLSEIMGRMLDSTQLKLQVRRQGSAREAHCVQCTKASQSRAPGSSGGSLPWQLPQCAVYLGILLSAAVLRVSFLQAGKHAHQDHLKW